MILLVAGVVVVLDRVSKIYIVGALDPGDSVTLIRGILDLTYVRNPGAIFGLFGSLSFLLIPIGLLVILSILYYSFRIRPGDRLLDLALALELGGATGNLIDRVAYGKVIDFIDFRVWPVFNLADSAISLGLFFLGLYLLLQIKSAREVG